MKEIHRYVEGCTLYIPNKSGNRKAWGVNSGIKDELAQRNISIRTDYANGLTADELSEKYLLSIETIKKIIYSH